MREPKDLTKEELIKEVELRDRLIKLLVEKIDMQEKLLSVDD